MRYFAIFSFFLSFASIAKAAPARFTTVFLDDEGVVYAGIKHGEPEVSEVVSFPFQAGERTNIPLPATIANRDVIGLLTEKEKLFVLTAPVSNAEDDGPLLYVYNRDLGKWNKVGGIECPTFTKVTMKSTQMIFSCEVGKSRKGKTHIIRKTISLRKNPIFRRGVWRFPEFLLRYKGRTVLLEGSAPNWDRIRLRSPDNVERSIAADDLLHLPLPDSPDIQPTLTSTSTTTSVSTSP
jgi:hypothetical protein